MKKFSKLIAFLLLVITAVCLVSCKPKVQTFENSVVIKVDAKYLTIDKDTVFLDYMNKLKEDGEIDFSIADGMVTSINGTENPADWSKCWMLYTDDEAFSNSQWGEIVVDGKTYYSATRGAESLPIKDGKTYVWGFVSFG